VSSEFGVQSNGPDDSLALDCSLCLVLQRSARVISRRLDTAMRPFQLTNEQFSLLVTLGGPKAPSVSALAACLGVDRTTLTASVKRLQRRRLVRSVKNPVDRRTRALSLTDRGVELITRVLPVWNESHREIERMVPSQTLKELCDTLRGVAFWSQRENGPGNDMTYELPITDRTSAGSLSQ
jgi:DNA-binding MarR family transcriptional regulator